MGQRVGKQQPPRARSTQASARLKRTAQFASTREACEAKGRQRQHGEECREERESNEEASSSRGQRKEGSSTWSEPGGEVGRNNVSQAQDTKHGKTRTRAQNAKHGEAKAWGGETTQKRQWLQAKKCHHIAAKSGKALPGRLELPTLRLTASRSNQLSYGSHVDEKRISGLYCDHYRNNFAGSLPKRERQKGKAQRRTGKHNQQAASVTTKCLQNFVLVCRDKAENVIASPPSSAGRAQGS